MSDAPEAASGPVIDQPPPRAERRPATSLLLLALLLILVLIGSAPFWAPAVLPLLPWSPAPHNDAAEGATARLDRRLTELAQRQAALDQSVARLGEQLKSGANPAGQQEMAAALRQLNDRLTQIEQRAGASSIDPAQLGAVQKDIAGVQAAVQKDIAALSERLGKLEARASEAGGQRSDQALLLAFNQLRNAVDNGRPYAGELAAVEKLGGGSPELQALLQPLAAAAQQPLPTVPLLARRFHDEAAPALLHKRVPAAEPSPDNAGWGEWLKAKLGALVTIRHVGENSAPVTASDPVGAAVARATTALAGNDLAGAVSAIGTLPESEQAPAQDWLAQARQRLNADQALAKLGDQLTARLAAAPQQAR